MGPGRGRPEEIGQGGSSIAADRAVLRITRRKTGGALRRGGRPMKRKTAKEIFAESIRELASRKSIDKITIQEIADNCGYSPATFYRHFRDKYDLIAWAHTRGVAEIMERVSRRSDPWKQTLLDGARWFCREKDYLANLIQNTAGHDSFAGYMVEINYAALEKQILAATGAPALDRKDALLVRAYCLGTVGLTCEWILGRFDASPEEIAEACDRALPPSLHPYLQ